MKTQNQPTLRLACRTLGKVVMLTTNDKVMFCVAHTDAHGVAHVNRSEAVALIDHTCSEVLVQAYKSETCFAYVQNVAHELGYQLKKTF